MSQFLPFATIYCYHICQSHFLHSYTSKLIHLCSHSSLDFEHLQRPLFVVVPLILLVVLFLPHWQNNLLHYCRSSISFHNNLSFCPQNFLKLITMREFPGKTRFFIRINIIFFAGQQWYYITISISPKALILPVEM